MTGIDLELCSIAMRRALGKLPLLPADRDELLQDALLYAWFKRGDFRGESAPQTWAYRVALTFGLMHLRLARRRSSARMHVELSTPDPVRRMEAREALLAIARRVDADMLELLAGASVEYAEVVCGTSTSVCALRCRVHRIRAAVRRMAA